MMESNDDVNISPDVSVDSLDQPSLENDQREEVRSSAASPPPMSDKVPDRPRRPNAGVPAKRFDDEVFPVGRQGKRQNS